VENAMKAATEQDEEIANEETGFNMDSDE